MRTLFQSVLVLAVILITLPVVQAQDDSGDTYFHLLDYMKVPPGGGSEYVAMEKAWKKIHQANIDAGSYVSWNLTQVLFPGGANEEYNYITRITFRGAKQLAEMMDNGPSFDNVGELLNEEEMDLFQRTNEIRTLVKSEIWTSIDAILPEDMETPKVIVFNYFDWAEGKGRQDHVQIEQNIWMPLHQANIAADHLEGWVLLGLMTPFGSDLPYHDATVDIYKSWDQFLNVDGSEGPDLESIHPGETFGNLIRKTAANADIVRQEIRVPVDRATAQ